MKRLFPLAALLWLPVLTVGCAPDDDDIDVDNDDAITAPVAPVDGVDADADGVTPIESGSGMSMTAPAPAGDAVADAGGDFEGQVVFSVPDMTCPYSCTPVVEKTLAGMPGVVGVKTDVKTQTATITVADGFDVEAAKQALADKQFPVANVN